MEGQNEPLRVQGYTARNAKKGKQYFMAVSIKKTALMVLLVLALLLALFAWTMRVQATPSMQFHTGIHSSHMLADGPNYTCLPPPRMC